MNSSVLSAILYGIDALTIEIQADISDGLPMFEMVGLLSSEVKESKERVRTALKNSGYRLPARHITVNMSPASIKKHGSGFDLPVAIAILHAQGLLPNESINDTLILGEIGLNGNVTGIDGILPIALMARENSIKRIIVPRDNVLEASLAGDIEVVGVDSLTECVNYLNGIDIPKENKTVINCQSSISQVDFSEVNGQSMLKRACEIAVSGLHNLLMVGPPGAGKSMIAKRIPTILPPLSIDESIEISKIYSVCGFFSDGKNGRLITERPFRAPHHTISPHGLAGGGINVKPGEVSLAHRGVLFLDELPEFERKTLEILRQPMEDNKILITRPTGTFTYPSDFLLVAALNPCPCGYYPDRQRCRCSKSSIINYQNKISQPLLDRIDITVEAAEITYNELVSGGKNESSEDIRKRVIRVHEIQMSRYKDEPFMFNSEIPVSKMETYCALDDGCKTFLEKKYEKLELTARSYHKIIKTARTIADLDESETIKVKHLREACSYRSLNKDYWEG